MYSMFVAVLIWLAHYCVSSNSSSLLKVTENCVYLLYKLKLPHLLVTRYMSSTSLEINRVFNCDINLILQGIRNREKILEWEKQIKETN